MAQEGETRKRKSSDDTRVLRKMRALSGYNVWHAEYMRSAESKTVSTLSAKNAESAKQWTAMPAEEKKKYIDEASSINRGLKPVNVKRESTRVLNHLQDVTDHASMLPGFHFMYVVVHNGSHYVGGTEKGCSFLRELGTHVPYSFLGYRSAQSESLQPLPSSEKLVTVAEDDKDTLRKAVEKLFNRLYGEFIKDATARLPYSKLKEYGISVDGLPAGKSLKHPSSYGRVTLQEILKNQENLKIHITKGPYSKQSEVVNPTRCSGAFLSTVESENSGVLLPPVENHIPTVSRPLPKQLIKPVKPLSSQPTEVDHTYFKVAFPLAN